MNLLLSLTLIKRYRWLETIALLRWILISTLMIFACDKGSRTGRIGLGIKILIADSIIVIAVIGKERRLRQYIFGVIHHLGKL